MSATARPAVPLRPVGPGRAGRAQPPGPNPWRPGHLLLAPHRLAFFLAMVLLLASGLGAALAYYWGWVAPLAFGASLPVFLITAASYAILRRWVLVPKAQLA